MVLEKYKAKRRFEKTSEPRGSVKKNINKHGSRFVIQKHAASHLHFDFRLEARGTLKSWALPKGVPELGEKHLAILVEDHPLEYQNFEGVIPKGNYGAGTVMIWDRGTYQLTGSVNNSELLKKIKKGDFSFSLQGRKVRGEFSMVRLKNAEENNWLLIRKSDSDSNLEKDNSIVSGKSMAEITDKKFDLKEYPEAKKKSMPDFVSPMLSILLEKPFKDKHWIFEIKWDGYRVVARKEKKEVKLYSRNKQNFNNKFSAIVESLRKIDDDFMVDGEVVALDENGQSSFQMLQNYLINKKGKLVYYIFDIMYLNGYDLMKISLKGRREILSKLISGFVNIRVSGAIEENGEALFDETVKHGGEGIIAKKWGSQYHSNVRGPDWLKIKVVLSQEAVICGFTEPRGGRNKFGALVLGVYADQKLTYIGNVGGGFNENLLSSVFEKLKPLITKKTPFETVPKTNMPVTWVHPRLVCAVKFLQWTQEGLLRQPVFLGLRMDKNSNEVHREIPEKNIVKKSDNKKNKDINSKNDEKVILTNLDKVYFPEDGFTKKDVIEYYRKISKYILPHIAGKPESLNRFPDGIYGESFFQKDMSGAPLWIEKVKIQSLSNEKITEYMVCNDKDSLIYMANLGCIEINPWNSSIGHLDNPDYMVFDIDPQGLPFADAVKVAKEIKKILDKIGLIGFCKTSGKRGLHIFVPLAGAYPYKIVQEFSKAVSLLVHRRNPEITSLERKPSNRKHKIYLDYLQNRKGQTMAAVYGIRPVAGMPVSTPIAWTELNVKLDPAKFNAKTIFKRLQKKGDIWKDISTFGVDLEPSIILLQKIIEKL